MSTSVESEVDVEGHKSTLSFTPSKVLNVLEKALIVVPEESISICPGGGTFILVLNASFGIFFPKFSGTIYEVLSAPISSFEITMPPSPVVICFVG